MDLYVSGSTSCGQCLVKWELLLLLRHLLNERHVVHFGQSQHAVQRERKTSRVGVSLKLVTHSVVDAYGNHVRSGPELSGTPAWRAEPSDHFCQLARRGSRVQKSLLA